MPLHLNLPDKEQLREAYMPFVQQGGLFLATNGQFELGEIVDVSLTLMDEVEPYLFSGKILWITPQNADAHHKPGIGVELAGDEGKQLRDQIEKLLVGLLDSDKPTHTI